MSGISAVTALSAAATVYSGSQQAKATKKASQAQQQANEAQARSASVEAQRARIAQVREARIRKGQVISAGTSGGLGMGTSGLGGAVGSIASQMGENIGKINQQQTFAQDTGAALQESANQQVKAQKWQQIGAFSQSIFQQAGGFTTIFRGNTSTGAK